MLRNDRYYTFKAAEYAYTYSIRTYSTYIHSNLLIEEIRKKVASLERSGWRIMFSWVKAHAGTYGNELADRLAKEAARSEGTNYEFTRIPKSTLYQEAEEETRQKWQREWTTSHKAAATKHYFPTVRDRLKTNKSHPKDNSHADWAWDDEGIPTSISPE